jgi:5-hydroxyisourate hydrolase
MSGITTHVLDTSTGRPAAGMRVELHYKRTSDDAHDSLADTVTDADGRCSDLGPEEVRPGYYTLTFHTWEWFHDQRRECFFPEVDLVFEVTESRHHHVPLLVAPFGYSTYRGS